MRILHRNGISFFRHLKFLMVPSCCKDYFLEKVLYMYQGSVGESVLILLWLYEPAIMEKFVIRDLF